MLRPPGAGEEKEGCYMNPTRRRIIPCDVGSFYYYHFLSLFFQIFFFAGFHDLTERKIGTEIIIFWGFLYKRSCCYYNGCGLGAATIGNSLWRRSNH